MDLLPSRRPTAAASRRRLVPLLAATTVLAGVVGACTDDEEPADEAAFCEQLGQMVDLDERLTLDATGLRAGVEELEALEAVAPLEVADEVVVLREAADAMAVAAESGMPEQAVAEPLRGQVPVVDTASARLADYAARTCDIELSEAVPTEPGLGATVDEPGDGPDGPDGPPVGATDEPAPPAAPVG